FWLAIFGLALLSFLPTYMSTAGALVYLTALGKTQASPAPDLSQSAAPTTAFSAVTLEDIGGAAGGRSVAVPAKGIRIGRGNDCDVVVESEYVSSAHVLIVPIEGGRISVQDLKSTNGTFVNDSRITTADAGAGDVIRLGSDPNARFTIRA
ncbi:MAG: FHA domain-containing protein, partial [Gemmatimonadetes bacterium]|nr:FHA domain-containing protein [Gemmatimonadota bacterium]